jgi:hypothetical protein
VKISIVDEKLLRGPSPFPLTVFKLKRQGITQICDLQHDCAFSVILKKITCKFLNINYKNTTFHIGKGELPDTIFFSTLNDNIMQNNGKTYLHCKKGRHRTGIAVAFYNLAKGKEVKKIIEEDLIGMGYGTHGRFTPSKIRNAMKKILADFKKQYG